MLFIKKLVVAYICVFLTCCGGGSGSSPEDTNPDSLSIGTQTIQDGTVKTSYTKDLIPSGGTLPYSWSIITGNLPDGLSLNASTGRISGIPITTTTSAFTVQLTDADNIKVQRSFSLQINPVVAINNCDCGEWYEGTQELDDGATRDFYNRGARLPWRNFMGDWHDASSIAQGDNPFTLTVVENNNQTEFITWNVTTLVKGWVDGEFSNKGLFIHAISGDGTFNFRSREHTVQEEIPVLEITTPAGVTTLNPVADTYLAVSTYQGMGDGVKLTVTDESPILIRFDLSQFNSGDVENAVLMLYKYEDYGDSMEIGIFRSSQGLELPESLPETGIAQNYINDEAIINHPDVLLFSDFESQNWGDDWTSGSNSQMIEVVSEDDNRLFEPFQNNAIRLRVAAGDNYGASLIYKFMDKTGEEPEEIYFRYYLRFADDWLPTYNGKLPGVSGTYGVAGWGGRPSDGTNGWSARGTYMVPIASGNPFEDHTAIGNYVYHADMEGTYGDIVLYTDGCRGILNKNKWYSVEQYVKMNSPGTNDGIIKAWIDGKLAYESDDWRFRTVDSLKIEQIWMNLYHGGTAVPPTDIHLYIDNVVIARSYIGPMAQ